ncbi:SPOR domain-containing protein [Sphingomonas sp. PL-96]|uniref:SPOR domain-containing protein n=1 Tax=Sphingomonas sp. PL-96 TaxID=2887201 RepID=UPI001E42E5F4|nr:SPOR domain-containing protein [Sphingomonas sp. PL-96]MCC2975315.1 SPOR domain-containing protein [Sphingomonas sp. PL-96]
MAERLATGMHARDEDRLPWLESVDAPPEASASLWRVLLLVLVALAVIGGVIWAALNLGSSVTGGGGNGAIIAAEKGPYKVKPDQPGGMEVEGTGDTVFATSDGRATGTATVDLSKVPEAPVVGQPIPTAAPAAAPTEAAPKVVAQVPASAGQLQARAPARQAAPAQAHTASGSVVQLGSFPQASVANSSWQRLSKRFGYLAPMTPSIEQAEVNGKTVYRLRVDAGSAGAAGQLCGKLKLAGEGCYIAR